MKSDKKPVKLWAVIFWLLLWQLAGMILEKHFPAGHILLATPIRAAVRLFELSQTAAFWKSCLYSTIRIVGGFMAGSLLAVVLAALSAKFSLVRELLRPAVAVIKSVPVVSFIILALIWLRASSLSLFISALMVFPTVYLSTLAGIDAADVKLSELARIYNIGIARRVWGIWLPQLMPYLRSALSAAVGLSWKSGTAAEVIALASGSVGERLYTSKVYFETADLFAWTVVLVLLSAVTETLVLAALELVYRKAGHR